MSDVTRTSMNVLLQQANIQNRKISALLVVSLIMIFAFGASVFFFSYEVTTRYPSDASVLEGDGYRVYINQHIDLIYSPNVEYPMPAAQTETRYLHEMDSTVNMTCTQPILLDTVRYFDPLKSLKIRSSGVADRLKAPVNISTGIVPIYFDETAELGFYYYWNPAQTPDGFKPFSAFILTVTNGVNVTRIGYSIYGNDRNGTINPQSAFKIGGLQQQYIPNYWINRNASYSQYNIWGLFRISDLRNDLIGYSYNDYIDTDINITKAEFYVGYDNSGQARTFQANFDYLQIISKPFEFLGGAWRDVDENIVNSYQIVTSYIVVALNATYNITALDCYSDIKLFIVDYVDINRLVPLPVLNDTINDLETYLDVIDMRTQTLNITTTTMNGSAAWRMEGVRSSNPIPLQGDVRLGTTLQYEFQANFTAIAQQTSGEWSYDSLDVLRDVEGFTVHIGGSVLVL